MGMIKFLIGFGITIIYSFFIYALGQKNLPLFINLLSFIVFLIGSYLLGDMVMYRYMGNL
jgi:hypothetical protein